MLSAKDVLFSLSHEIEEDAIELADTCPVEIWGLAQVHPELFIPFCGLFQAAVLCYGTGTY